jgi:hypothetical protein
MWVGLAVLKAYQWLRQKRSNNNATGGDNVQDEQASTNKARADSAKMPSDDDAVVSSFASTDVNDAAATVTSVNVPLERKV